MVRSCHNLPGLIFGKRPLSSSYLSESSHLSEPMNKSTGARLKLLAGQCALHPRAISLVYPKLHFVQLSTIMLPSLLENNLFFDAVVLSRHLISNPQGVWAHIFTPGVLHCVPTIIRTFEPPYSRRVIGVATTEVHHPGLQKSELTSCIAGVNLVGIPDSALKRRHRPDALVNGLELNTTGRRRSVQDDSG
jgi:hypothetical protein